jgi:hypothetical protein
MRALGCEQLVHAFVDRGEIVFGQVAEGDAALVGDDDDGDPRFVQPADGGGCAGQETEVVGLVDEGGLIVDDPISVDKDSDESADGLLFALSISSHGRRLAAASAAAGVEASSFIGVVGFDRLVPSLYAVLRAISAGPSLISRRG